MAQNPIEEVQVLHTFTPKEIQELGVRVASKVAEKENKESEKKSIASQYKADIDAITTQIKSLSNRINEGHESRTVLAEKVKNVETKCWDYLDINTRLVLKSVPFQSKDFQGQQLSITDPEGVDPDGYKEPYNGPKFSDDDDDDLDNDDESELVSDESDLAAEAEEQLDQDEPYASDEVDPDHLSEYGSEGEMDSEPGYEAPEPDYNTDDSVEPATTEEEEEPVQSLGAAIEDLKAKKSAAKKSAAPKKK